MCCKKGGFISIRYNDLRNLMTNTKLEVWKDTEVEPKLTTLYEDELHGRTLNNSNEARADIRIGRVFST